MTPQAKLEIVMDRLRTSTCALEADRAQLFDAAISKDGTIEHEGDARHLAYLDGMIAENRAALNIQVQRRKVVGA